MGKTIFFGHWRHLLKIARDQAKFSPYLEADRIAHHAASIILSRTCLEIYINELYFLQIHEGVISKNDKFFSKENNREVKLIFREFASLHICERIEISFPKVARNILSDVLLQNQIRNYCTHYTASDVKKNLEKQFKSHSFLGRLSCADLSPQEEYINQDSALWCNDVSLRTILAVEDGQLKRNANSELNMQFCNEMMR